MMLKDMSVRRVGKKVALVMSMVVLAGCGTSKVQPQDSSLSFWLADGTSVPGDPQACGAPIPLDQVATIDVTGEADPRAVVARSFAKVSFARDEYVLVDLTGSVPQTRNRVVRYFSQLGCNLVVFGEAKDRKVYTLADPENKGRYSIIVALPLLWGMHGEADD